jgi:hypothetical protein
VQDNGRLAPGASADAVIFSPATLRIEDLTLTGPTTSLLIQLGGLAPGTGFDQLLMSGNATLAGALSVSLANGFSLAAGQSFRVLDITGSRSGQFAGLGEGAIVGNFGGTDLFITYAAGNGNDVSLFTAGSMIATADFDEDGDVDGDDLMRWRNNFGTGTTHMTGDADGDLDVDSGDFLTWQRQLGMSPALFPASTPVPEPATCWLFIVATAGIRRIGSQMRQELVSE